MRRIVFLFALLGAMTVSAQSIQVGDSVVVKRSAKRWMTGERISSWVYLQPHMVSQVDSKYHPGGILLNVAGAKSWLLGSEAEKLHAAPAPAPAPVAADTVTPPAEPTPAPEPMMVEAMVEQEVDEQVETSEPVVSTVVELVIEPTAAPAAPMAEPTAEPFKPHFQFYGGFLQAFAPHVYSAGGQFIFGARLREYAYIGGGVDFSYCAAGENAAHSMEFPVFAHAKFYLPIHHKYFPYLEVSAGANMGYRTFTPDKCARPDGFHYGAYAQGGVGIDLLKYLSLSVGYQYAGGLSNVTKDQHQAYLKVGFVIPE